MNEGIDRQQNNPESRADHLKAANELARELLPQLESDFPLAYNSLQEHLDNDFVDNATGEDLDAGEILSRIQNVMNQRATFNQADLSRTMEALAQGIDPDTGDRIHSGGTPQ